MAIRGNIWLGVMSHGLSAYSKVSLRAHALVNYKHDGEKRMTFCNFLRNASRKSAPRLPRGHVGKRDDALGKIHVMLK